MPSPRQLLNIWVTPQQEDYYFLIYRRYRGTEGLLFLAGLTLEPKPPLPVASPGKWRLQSNRARAGAGARARSPPQAEARL